MPKKQSTLVNALLFSVFAAGGLLELMQNASPYKLRRRLLFGRGYNSYRHTVYGLKRRGLVRLVGKKGTKFLELTKKGEMEVLLAKAKIPASGKWDGKWRALIFDIPKSTGEGRDRLRNLLKKNNFYKLQASVYVSPYPLNREAIEYLQQTGLCDYIRIMKIEEMDDDKDLKKKFNIK